MKYVLLGQLGQQWIKQHERRVELVMQKFDELGITLDAVYYTQGSIDFIDVVDCPDAESILAFSMWYAGEGFGQVESLPAFDSETLVRAARKV